MEDFSGETLVSPLIVWNENDPLLLVRTPSATPPFSITIIRHLHHRLLHTLTSPLIVYKDRPHQIRRAAHRWVQPFAFH